MLKILNTYINDMSHIFLCIFIVYWHSTKIVKQFVLYLLYNYNDNFYSKDLMILKHTSLFFRTAVVSHGNLFLDDCCL